MEKKDLSFPGNETLLLVSAHSLLQDSKQALLKWVQQNWIALDELDHGKPVYAKPYSVFDYKAIMKGSHDGEDDLKTILQKKRAITSE